MSNRKINKRPNKIKRDIKLNIKMKKKIIVVFSFILVILLFLIGRIIYISLVSGDKYKKQVLDQHDSDSKKIPYKRGDIVDRNGTVLATSIDVYNIILDCKVLNANPKYITSTVEKLVEYFPELEADAIYKLLKRKKNSQYIVLKKKVDYELVEPFKLMQKEKKIMLNYIIKKL